MCLFFSRGIGWCDCGWAAARCGRHGAGGGGDGDGGADDEGEAGDDDARARFSWTLARTPDVGSACDGGAFFAVVLAVVMSPVAWLVFATIKPSRFEKEQFAMEFREAEEVARRQAGSSVAVTEVPFEGE